MQKIRKIEARRKYKLKCKRRYYERRNEIEGALTRWWKDRILELRIYDQDVKDMLYNEYEHIVRDT